MRRNPWNPYIQAGLKRLLPRAIYLRYVGRHEHGSLKLWREMAAKVPADRAILDIGAYLGEYALAAREVNGSAPVFAFEPNPESIRRLRGTCVSQRIVLEEVAVAESSGGVRLLLDVQRSQMSKEGTPVRALSLDDWRTTTAIQVALVKIDTEGAEAQILRGAGRLIEECRPTILCEVLSGEAGSQVMDILATFGYRYLRINEDRGAEERPKITRDHWRHKNWLLVPR